MVQLAFSYRHDDDQAGWYVSVEQIVAQTSFKHEHDFQACEVSR